MEARFNELKRYVRFDADDAARLAAFRPTAAPHFVRVAREFYERIREHEEAHAVFTGEAQIERLQRSMVLWMGRLLSGTYDASYYEETANIGRVHVRVGLPQRYMFTAMALIRVSLERIAEDELGAASAPTRDALTRLLDLELAIMVESYREHMEARVQRNDDMQKQVLRGDIARMLKIYDVTPSLVIGLDQKGLIRLFNREAQHVTGFGSEEVIGSSFVEVLVPEDCRAKDQEVIQALLGAGETRRSRESLLKTRAGKLRDVRWELSRVRGDAAEDVVLFAFGSDITEVRANAERARQHEKLAAVGTLAAGLAHEIRNPLNGAQLHVSFLERAIKKKDADAEMLEAVAVVDDEIKRLARLVTEFLDFARPKPLQRKPVVIQALIARVLELVSAQAASAGVERVTDVPPQDLVISADPGKLDQVLLNILQNAIEALSPTGGGHVTVRARRQPRDVVLEIEDDGPGLPSPDAPVFDAFFSTKATGTGLGLAITHRIVTDHGGSIDVESRPGRTCFKLTIPIGREAEELEKGRS